MALLSQIREPLAGQGLVRPRQGRIVAGVAAGIARRFGISVTVVRLLFVASIVLPGPQFLLYIALWVLMPKESAAGAL